MQIRYNETIIKLRGGRIIMDFVHLQVRSGYSFMKSTNTIEKVVEQAKQYGYTSLALTDEGVMYGAISFYQTCKKHGIKPIIGLSVPIFIDEEQVDELVLLAQDQQGYENLMQLSSYVQMSEEYVERRELSQYTKGCIGILPIYNSHLQPFILHNQRDELSKELEQWKHVIGPSDFYLGIEDHGLEGERHLQVAIEQVLPAIETPMVALNDVRYIKEDDALAYDCLQSIRKNEHWSQQIEDHSIKHRHLRSMEEMYTLFGEWSKDLLENTKVIADRCNLDLILNRMMLPEYPVPHEVSSADYLRQLCEKGLKRRYTYPNEEITSRLSHELQVIETMGFSDYFLIVWDFITYAKKHNISTGPGRGSAAGSLVSYLLGITEVDPIEYDLLFERFLNPERVSMPDIDIDFSDVKRDQVIQYVMNKYGADHVAQIITFGTFGARSTIRELIKVMGVDNQEASYLMKFIPQTTSQSIVQIVQDSKDLQAYIQQSQTLKRLFKIAARLEGLPRHASTHAAGVIISKQPLMKHVALTEGHDSVPLTQYAMNELETIGLLKMDFLGLRNLTLIEKMTQTIYENEGKDIQFNQKDMVDEKTFALLRSGKTTGIFQLESKGMKDVLMQLRPTHFEDIVAVNALYRPGPMEYIPTYIRRKHGKESVSYPHPDLAPILEKTYGVLVYQEQIMQIANKMAGFSLGQADLLRRAVSKKQQDMMADQEKAFVAGCKENGYSKEVGDQLYEWIVRFSNYGFNRSHAVAYSVISYQLAFLKAHYPASFMAELMSTVSSDKILSYLREAKELGIIVQPPSINQSFGKFTVENGQIRMGLGMIKGVGRNAILEILQARKQKPFLNLFDFCRRVSLKVINRQVLESLILAGCFDETFDNRASLLASIQHAIEQGELFSDMNDQESLFDDEIELDATYVESEPFDILKRLSFEKEVLGMYVSSHPLESYRSMLRSSGYLSLQDVYKSVKKKRLKAAVVVEEIKTIRTKRGDPMAFLTFIDENSEMEAVIFPDVFRDVKRWLVEEMLVFIEGRIEDRNGKQQWIIESITPFDSESLQGATQQRLFLKIEERESDSITRSIKVISKRYPGEVPIILYYAVRKETFKLAHDYSVSANRESIEQFKELLGEANVVLK